MSFLGTIGSDSDVVTIGIQRWLMALCLAIIWLIEVEQQLPNGFQNIM